MKKSKLSLGLVTGFVASLALGGCSSVSAKDHALLTFTSYDGSQTFDIVTEKMYEEYRKDSKVISTFYDKILEVLIRDLFQSGKTIKNATKDYEQIKALAEDDVNAAKAKASESAKTNGSSYDSEWESLLSGEGVEDEQELLEKYIYSQEKTVLEDALYASLNEDDELKEAWINTTLPYHVRHILTKVDSGASNYTRGTISASQAKSLSDVGLALGLGNDTFSGVAALYSEDSSNTTFGDVGLVTNKVSSSGSFSMVTEFQLAIYIYDAIYRDQTDAAKVDQLVKTSTTDATAVFNKITRVPYQVFKELANKDNGGYGDVEDRDGYSFLIQDDSFKETVYPRNILWNKYLNHHEPFLITNDSIADVDKTGTALTVDQIKAFTADEYTNNVDPNGVGGVDATVEEVTGTVTGFRKASDCGISQLGNTLILTDEKANPIFGVRSEYGIHFIIIEKSAFESTQTLKDYYQAYSPKQAEWTGNRGQTYVDYSVFTDEEMLSRAQAVKDAIKGFDGTYQYRIYKYLMDSTTLGGTYKASERFNISDPNSEAAKLLSEIDNYITLQEEKNAYDQETGYEVAWRSFVEMFEEQTEERSKYERVVPYGCAIGFKTVGNDALYAIGGPCYYGNKK